MNLYNMDYGVASVSTKHEDAWESSRREILKYQHMEINIEKIKTGKNL